MSDEKCGAECRDGSPCQNYPVTGSERCRMHGGKTPTKEENPKQGNGDQDGNQNPLVTGFKSDPVNLFEYLKKKDEQAAAWIMAKLIDHADDADWPVFTLDARDEDPETIEEFEAGLTARGYDLLMTCVRDYTRWLGTKKQLKKGLTVEREQATEFGTIEYEDANPINLELDRMDRTVLRMKEKDGLLSSQSIMDGDLSVDISYSRVSDDTSETPEE